MEHEKLQVRQSLINLFESASDIFVDPATKECEVKVSVDEYQGEISGLLYDNNVKLEMIDYWDTYPYKYVFSYKTV
ncbi:MAG: hypothetical protein K9I94_04920 [Bacteroidales bacterium]|nr:hypothetical protein [Bacteroidales bacterium]